MMGEAKRKGDHGVRVANALARIDEFRPDAIICNGCEAKLTEIQTLDVRGVEGIDAAFAAHCSDCSSSTYALKGTPDAVLSFQEYMREEHGKDAFVGMQGSKVL